jgi:hypothetical protein
MGDALPAMHISPECGHCKRPGSAKPAPRPTVPMGIPSHRERAGKAAAARPGQMRHAQPRQIQRWSTSSRFT